jgi:glycosyltransferase involved in cell wall biosynthesis
MEMHRFSFIIPVLNGEKYIRQCLESIICEMDAACDEIIVVDNGSTDKTISIVNAYSNIKVLELPKLTIAAMRNAGAKSAMGDLFAFIDSDCTIILGWRKSVIEVFEDGINKIGATGSKYQMPDNSSWIAKAWSSNKPSQRSFVKWISSGNLIIRRDAFEKVSGFNEHLITDEDYDIGLRLNEIGFLIAEEPNVGAIHHKNPDTLGKFYRRERWYATSMLYGASKRRLDKPLVMSLLFLISIFASIGSLIIAPTELRYTGIWVLIILIILFVTVLNRVIRYRNFKYIPHLGILYLIYYFAKANTIIAFIGRKIGIINRQSQK